MDRLSWRVLQLLTDHLVASGDELVAPRQLFERLEPRLPVSVIREVLTRLVAEGLAFAQEGPDGIAFGVTRAGFEAKPPRYSFNDTQQRVWLALRQDIRNGKQGRYGLVASLASLDFTSEDVDSLIGFLVGHELLRCDAMNWLHLTSRGERTDELP